VEKIIFDWQVGLLLYGSILSTILAILKIIEYIVNKPKLSIVPKVEKEFWDPVSCTSIKGQFLKISISNTSNKDIKIYTVNIKPIKGRSFEIPASMNCNLPYLLKGSDRFQIVIELEKVKEKLIESGYTTDRVNIIIMLIDGTNKIYRSKKYTLIPSEKFEKANNNEKSRED